MITTTKNTFDDFDIEKITTKFKQKNHFLCRYSDEPNKIIGEWELHKSHGYIWYVNEIIKEKDFAEFVSSCFSKTYRVGRLDRNTKIKGNPPPSQFLKYTNFPQLYHQLCDAHNKIAQQQINNAHTFYPLDKNVQVSKDGIKFDYNNEDGITFVAKFTSNPRTMVNFPSWEHKCFIPFSKFPPALSTSLQATKDKIDEAEGVSRLDKSWITPEVIQQIQKQFKSIYWNQVIEKMDEGFHQTQKYNTDKQLKLTGNKRVKWFGYDIVKLANKTCSLYLKQQNIPAYLKIKIGKDYDKYMDNKCQYTVDDNLIEIKLSPELLKDNNNKPMNIAPDCMLILEDAIKHLHTKYEHLPQEEKEYRKKFMNYKEEFNQPKTKDVGKER